MITLTSTNLFLAYATSMSSLQYKLWSTITLLTYLITNSRVEFLVLYALILISLAANGLSNLIYKVLNLGVLSILVAALWSFLTDFNFVQVVYVLAFVGAVVMLFLSVILMLPSSVVATASHFSILLLQIDNGATICVSWLTYLSSIFFYFFAVVLLSGLSGLTLVLLAQVISREHPVYPLIRYTLRTIPSLGTNIHILHTVDEILRIVRLNPLRIFTILSIIGSNLFHAFRPHLWWIFVKIERKVPKLILNIFFKFYALLCHYIKLVFGPLMAKVANNTKLLKKDFPIDKLINLYNSGSLKRDYRYVYIIDNLLYWVAYNIEAPLLQLHTKNSKIMPRTWESLQRFRYNRDLSSFTADNTVSMKPSSGVRSLVTYEPDELVKYVELALRKIGCRCTSDMYSVRGKLLTGESASNVWLNSLVVVLNIIALVSIYTAHCLLFYFARLLQLIYSSLNTPIKSFSATSIMLLTQTVAMIFVFLLAVPVHISFHANLNYSLSTDLPNGEENLHSIQYMLYTGNPMLILVSVVGLLVALIGAANLYHSYKDKK